MRNYHAGFSHVITYISNIPYLYRYEDKKYIDDFFENGNLFISSFQNYKKYKDNELGDVDEGTSFNVANIADDKQITTYTTIDNNNYTFCTSTIYEKKLLDKFSRNSVFRIADPLNFILELTRSIQRVQGVLHGNCIYVDNRIIQKKYPQIDESLLINQQGELNMNNAKIISDEIQGVDAFFFKKKNYQEQSEYRIIWQTDREISGGIIIKCPEAVKYCQRIEFD